MLIVQKFGGTSVAGPKAVRRVAGILSDTKRSGADVVAVLSAQGDSTDDLLSRASQYNANPSRRELDMLLSTGEQVSVALMAMALEDMGIPAVSLTGWQAGISTDDVHGNARIRRLSMGRVKQELSDGKIVLVAGFQGLGPGEDITTLGRGGSDTTAVAIAAALQADSCQIFTDVEGIYTADPRLVPGASRLDAVDTAEMLQLAAMGSQVLHERSVEVAMRCGVPLEVLSSFVRAPGTKVTDLPLPPEEGRLTAMTKNGALVSLVGTRLRLFRGLSTRAENALHREFIPMLSFLETDSRLTVHVPEAQAADALRCLHREFLES